MLASRIRYSPGFDGGFLPTPVVGLYLIGRPGLYIDIVVPPYSIDHLLHYECFGYYFLGGVGCVLYALLDTISKIGGSFRALVDVQNVYI